MNKKGAQHLVVILCLFSFLLNGSVICFADFPAGEPVVYVDDDYDGDTPGWEVTRFNSIKDAVNDVAEDGEVIVNAGTYNENVFIDKPLSLLKNDSSVSRPVINGQQTTRSTIEINVDNVFISGFEITNDLGEDNNFHGVSLGKFDGILYSVSNCIIMDCYITDVYYGVFLRGSTNSVSQNIVYEGSEAGIFITSGSTNVISENTLTNNFRGIQLDQSAHSTAITGNTITNDLGNKNYGIYIPTSSSGNTMYHNHLDNYENALDQGTDNTWDNGYPSGGNWWSDYTGTDDNEDGIGDIPYSKNGVTDLYPTGKFQSTQNQDPVATIQSIQPSTASYGEPVQFTGSGWDPDGDSIVGYHWRSSMQGPLSTQASFSTTSLSPGSHVIFFKVQDSNGAWSPEKTRSITVTNPQNQAPIAHIQSISPQNPDFGEPVWFQGYGTDADGTIFSYKWVSSLDDVINTSLSFSTSLLSVGTHSISFFVMDNEGEWSEADHGVVTVTATSTATNQPPTANPGGPYTIEVNTTLILDGSDSFDPDGTIVVYSWDFGDDTTGKGRTVDHQYSTVGNKTIVLQVTDNNGTSSTASTKVTVVATGMLPDNNDINQNDEPGLVLPIPQTLLLPLAIIIVFFGVFGGFLYWVKRPR